MSVKRFQAVEVRVEDQVRELATSLNQPQHLLVILSRQRISRHYPDGRKNQLQILKAFLRGNPNHLVKVKVIPILLVKQDCQGTASQNNHPSIKKLFKEIMLLSIRTPNKLEQIISRVIRTHRPIPVFPVVLVLVTHRKQEVE